VKTLTLLAACLTLGSTLVVAQMRLTNDDVVAPISRVKETPASRIDPTLPPVALEKWLGTQAGPDAAVGWAVRTADDPGQGLPWVEADISLRGHPALVIMIATGTSRGGIATKPRFRSLHQLIQAGDVTEWTRLRDFPAALKRARDLKLGPG
jgi:hypothetical protein